MTCHSKQTGFSLLEVLIVLLIVSLATAMTTSAMFRSSPSKEAQRFAQNLMSMMEDARSAALVTGEAKFVSFDPDRKLVGHGQNLAGAVKVPDHMQVRLTYASDLLQPGITFFPQGGSTGGTFEIEQSGSTRRLEVDWLLGVSTWQDAEGDTNAAS